MNLLNTYIYELRFYIDDDAPKDYMKRWHEFKLSCENGENEHIVKQIRGHCKLGSNKKLPYLDRVEGGMGGNNNLTNKQIRFRCHLKPRYIDKNIILDEIISSETEKWTYSELDDLIYGFIKTANCFIKGEYINGCIEMINKKMRKLIFLRKK